MRRILLLTLSLALPTAALDAQVGRGEQGLMMVKGSGNAGVLCSYRFSCSFLKTGLVRGESVTLWVRGVYNRPFAVGIGLAPQQPLCLTVAGLHNKLNILPSFVPFAGVLDERDTIRACPGGRKSMSFRVPPGLAPGSSVAFQAVAWSFLAPSQVPTLTMTIVATVR